MTAVDIYKLGPELKPDGTYCSPWCGCGCTKKNHDDACKKAKALAKRMGANWTTDVWESLGWHYAVRSPCGRIHLHAPHRTGDTYTAFLGEPGAIGGKWTALHKNPKKAVAEVVKAAKTDLEDLTALLEGL